MIREFQVITSGASAEFGRTAAGAFNIVTNSGTKRLHPRQIQVGVRLAF